MRPRIAKRGLVFGVLVVIIATLVGLWIFRPVLYRIEPLAEYDYVIVGAGTSGCVLAERLSAQPSNNVLLIEAGGEAPWYSWIPFASPFIQGTRHDWQYFTVAQKHAAAALQNRESSWPQGKMLGGTGQMNFMIHTSGSAEDFDSWKISGWEAKSMVAILDRLSCWIPQDGPEVQDEFIASSMSWFGEVSTDAVCDHQSPCDHAKTVSRQQQCPITAIKVEKIDVETSPLAAAFLDAGRLLGRPVRDLNQWWRQPGPFGFMASQNTIHEGYRWSTFRSHLQPVLQRPNLHVLPHSTVSKVLLDGRRAIGVQLTDARGRSRTVAAQREVLLSAGAIKSPQILQLSGIGSPHVLEPLDIPLLADLPVGKNLQDHLQVPLFVELVNSSVSVNIAKMLRPTQLWNYLMHRTGMLASSGIEGIATFPLRSNTSSTSHGMLILFNLGSIDANAYSRVANIHLSAFHKWFPKADNFHQEGFVLLSVCLHPKSRGQVRIRTTDVSDHPEIDPDYLSHPDDVRCLADSTINSNLHLWRLKNLQEGLD